MISATREGGTMSEYGQRMEDLRVELMRVKGLMEGHPQGSDRYHRLYDEYCDLEDERNRLGEAIPHLIKLDAALTNAARTLAKADSAAHEGSGWSPLAMVSGLIGLALVLVSPAWMPTVLMPVIGCVLLVVAAGGLVLGRQDQRAADAQVADAQTRLWELTRERDELLGERQTAG